jgi:simple sugar transport system permease protein
MDPVTLNILSSIVANATPLVIAGLGETISERSGVINLSLDGSLALTAMLAFAVTITTGSPLLGIGVAMLVGAFVALLIAVADIELRQDQVAIGFVLTLLAADVAQFLGQDFAGRSGSPFTAVPLPILSDIPILGPVLFNHSVFVYLSYILILVTWFWLFQTRGGLAHRAVGERPEAAYARGTPVNRLRYLYTILGGAMIGIAGASYSLAIKPGWSTPPGMRGDGWIALAIVIFGGWHPYRVVLGAYLFAALRQVASAIQRSDDIQIPIQLLNALPWLLMIFTLLLVSSGWTERVMRLLPRPVQRLTRNVLRSDQPAALGTRFTPGGG